MATLVFFIEQISNGLYILIALGMLLCWRGWRRARIEYRSTHFELERDLARFRQGNALTVFVLLAELALVILGVQRVVAPAVREELGDVVDEVGIVTDGVFNTPTPSISTGGQIDASGVQIGATDPALQVLATPTLTPTPVGTIVPNPPSGLGCDTPNATLQLPANGMRVFQPITIVGTAFTDNFAFYRIELRGPITSDNYAFYDEQTVPVLETSELGQFNPAPFAQGPDMVLYQFRLMVFDITNTPRASCMVNIYISDPVPTPTPIAQPTQPPSP
jgi:hypothetical protein